MNQTAKTKIIATIGPSSWDEQTLKEMFKSGMQVARINCSFADEDEIEKVTRLVRKISPRIAILLDTKGTKIRIKGLEKEIEVKDSIKITDQNNIPDTIQIDYPNLHTKLTPNTPILLDDGTIELKVEKIEGAIITCQVIQPGILKPNKTVNIPSLNLEFPTLTEKDKTDILLGKKYNVDFISLSFVRNREDIITVRNLLGETDIKIIAKIENNEGIENFDEILEEADAIMIARGDLGVETPLENVPILQKQMIYKCRSKAKPVIVATQMLESMRENIKPTRAEVSDVANSVMDGTDAIMLSAETSTGNNPVEAVKMMNKISLNAESVMQLSPIYGQTSTSHQVDEICKNACFLAESIPLKGIISFSNDINTITSITRHRPNVPIWSVNQSPTKVRQASLIRGVRTYYVNSLPNDRDEIITKAIQTIFTHGELDLTDKIAIISGSSIKQKDSDVILEIVTIKDVLSR